MDKDEPIDDVSDADKNIDNSEDETIIGPPPDLDGQADLEAVPADDATILDFGSLDSEEGESFDVDKTVNFKPLEEDSGDDFDIDKTVNFAPLDDSPSQDDSVLETDEASPVEEVDLDALPVTEGEVNAAEEALDSPEELPGEEIPVSEGDLDGEGELPDQDPLDSEGDLDAEEAASSIELPPEEEAVEQEKPKTLPRGTRRRNLPSTKVKRRSAAEHYKSTATGDKSLRVKKIFFYGLPISFVAIIVAGFIPWGKNEDPPWIGALKRAGILENTPPKKSGPGEENSRIRPEVADFQTLEQRISFVGGKVQMLETDLRVTEEWNQEKSMKARGELDTVLALLETSTSMAERLKEWFEVYSADYEALQKAHEDGDKGREEELNTKLQRDKYDDVDTDKLGQGHVTAAVNRAKALQRRADSLNARIPSMEEIAEGKVPEGRAKKEDGSHGGGTSVSFNPSIVTPYFFVSTGAWIRAEVVTEDLALFGEPIQSLVDTILSAKELRKNYVVLKKIQFVNDLESDPSEERLDVVASTDKVEAVSVGDSSLQCRVLRSDSETRWVLTSGKMANQLPIKVEKEEYTMTAVEVGEESVSVGEETLSCIRVLYEGSQKGRTVTQTVWYSTRVPLWVVKRETEIENSSRITETVLSYGKSARPAFPVPEKEEDTPGIVELPPEEDPTEETPTEEVPTEEVPTEEVPTEETPAEEKPSEETPTEEKPTEENPKEDKPETPKEEKPEEAPKPPEKTSEDHMREAKVTLKQASGLFIEVSKVIQKGLPSEKEKLKTVQEKADKAEKLFREAIEGYRTAQGVSSDPDRQEVFIRRLQKLLELLAKNQEIIRKKIEE